MYCRQRRHLYYGGQIYKYYLPLLHCSSPFIRGLCCQAIQTEHGPYMTERTQKSICIMRCLCLLHRDIQFRITTILVYLYINPGYVVEVQC
jgi:hypothetical protein